MKTNSKEVRNKIKQHIIDRVYDAECNNYDNIKDASKRLNDEFNRVAGHEYNLKRFPNEQERFSDYLSGLPFNFEYYYDGIKQYLNSLGINPGNKKYSSDKSLKLYHYLIFREMKSNL